MKLLKFLKFYFIGMFTAMFITFIDSVPRHIAAENRISVYVENPILVISFIAAILSLVGLIITLLLINERNRK